MKSLPSTWLGRAVAVRITKWNNIHSYQNRYGYYIFIQYFEIDKLFSIKTLLIYRECFCIALKFINRLLLSFFALFDLMSQFTGD